MLLIDCSDSLPEPLLRLTASGSLRLSQRLVVGQASWFFQVTVVRMLHAVRPGARASLARLASFRGPCPAAAHGRPGPVVTLAAQVSHRP
jgi:hypothetical protein